MSPWWLLLILPAVFVAGEVSGYYRCATSETNTCSAFDRAFNDISDGGAR